MQGLENVHAPCACPLTSRPPKLSLQPSSLVGTIANRALGIGKVKDSLPTAHTTLLNRTEPTGTAKGANPHSLKCVLILQAGTITRNMWRLAQTRARPPSRLAVQASVGLHTKKANKRCRNGRNRQRPLRKCDDGVMMGQGNRRRRRRGMRRGNRTESLVRAWQPSDSQDQKMARTRPLRPLQSIPEPVLGGTCSSVKELKEEKCAVRPKATLVLFARPHVKQ